jgi:hypothetical protein
LTPLRWFSQAATLASAAAILVLTLAPLPFNGASCLLGIPCDAGHFLTFGVLGVSLAGVFVTSAFARRSPRRALSMMLLGVWIFAAATEIAQGEVGRDPSLADWGADMAGAVAGLLGGGFALRLLLGRRLPVAAPVEPPAGSRSRRTSSARRR